MNPVDTAAEGSWERLDVRMILVDVVKLVLSLAPAGIALWGFGVEPTLSATWPLVVILVVGLCSAGADILRWIRTRYRVTETHVERRTGLFVRKYRSILRERIRSVEAEAKLRHKLFGLRMVKVGAGQQNTAGESALVLNAVSQKTAAGLREKLLEDRHEDAPAEQVIQDIRYHWVIYNIFNSFAYIAAVGALWVVYVLLTTFGLAPLELLRGVFDWQQAGWPQTAVVALAMVGVTGVLILVGQFYNENWGFRLSRVQGQNGTLLRTSQGLLRTREVDREDHRIRGIEVSEPLLWRWMRLADTGVLTTGLSIWSMSPTILPRGPVSVARRVAGEVLQESSPLDVELRHHPAAALRRRLIWATTVTAIIVVGVGWARSVSGASVVWPWWGTVAAVWPAALLLAVAGYRHLGHALSGRYVVVRGSVMSRKTAALQTRAVSGITIRQSLLQQRLRLATVSFTTAVGEGKVTAADLGVNAAHTLLTAATPELRSPLRTPGQRRT